MENLHPGTDDSTLVDQSVQQGAENVQEQKIVDAGSSFSTPAVREKCKLNLIQRFRHLNEVINPGKPTFFHEVYTELYIIDGEKGKVNTEHEVRQIEAASRREAAEETPIECSEMFKPVSGEDKPVRKVLTKGVAGIGKTVSVQKFILDWAEGKTNQDIGLIFPLPFRELNLLKDQKQSVMKLLRLFSKEMKETNISNRDKVLLIFDGLDECRFPLDFQTTARVSDVTEPASVDVLLINLIKGNLLPSAHIWITSRPAAADQIPSEYVDRVTEVRGFNDPQKEEYFRKRISDPNLADDIITHLKTLRSLYIMCHIPVFCWISSTVLERMLGEAEGREIPKTLTQMYTHFLIIQTHIIREKYPQKQESHEEMLLKLGKLAFQQLMKGNLIFYQEDLMECDIDVTEASVYSGVCTQIFREEFGLHLNKVYCFVHLSIQEHLAALYVHLSFVKERRNVLHQSPLSKVLWLLKKQSILDLHKSAVEKVLRSENGHLDLLLRFLLGLSSESDRTLLQAIVTQTQLEAHSNQETVFYIRKKITANPSTEKSINLFHCLHELGDHSLVQKIQQYLQSGDLQESHLSPSQWSAVVFVLLTTMQEHDEFVLNKYINRHCSPDDVLLRLQPVVSASRKAECNNCDLTEKGCTVLASVLSSESSNLRELELSGNIFRSAGVKCLSAGLGNPHCKLQILRLRSCDVSDEGCVALTSALRSNSSHLRELDLSENKLRDSGVKTLSAVLENPQCQLKTLKLCDCGVSDEGCAVLMSALRSNPSHLRELDLSRNTLRDSGVNPLCSVLENPDCKLETLKLSECGVSDEGCAALMSALRSNPTHLRELDLSDNNLRDAGVKYLSNVLENHRCHLETLNLGFAGVPDEGCVAVTSALRSNPSHLKVLNLSGNELHDAGIQSLCALLRNPHCKLEKLMINYCGVPDEGCTALISALRSNPSHLKELNLSNNKPRDTGAKCLSAVLENPQCKLETLNLCYCEVSDEGCAFLASALISNPSHLRELDLSANKLRDSGVKRLSDVLKNPLCKLKLLSLCYCEVSDEGCAFLASALISNPSHLRELDLSANKLRDSGVKRLSDVLKNPLCKLEKLRLYDCNVSDESCAALYKALTSNPSYLRKLDLSNNKLRVAGVKFISAVLRNPHCKLEILSLSNCEISDEGCDALTSALRLNPLYLRELDLSANKLRDSGVKCFSAVLKDRHCKLKVLRLDGCDISDESCSALISALKLNSSLTYLDLEKNKFRDSLKQQLFGLKLQTLKI